MTPGSDDINLENSATQLTHTQDIDVGVNLRVDLLAMEPVEEFVLMLSFDNAIFAPPDDAVVIQNLTVHIIDNDSECKARFRR